MLSHATLDDAATLLAEMRAQGLTLATAESCTGGLIAAALTAIAGSSDVVQAGFVTYSNAAKASMLGVPPAMIEEHGAVSAAVAQAMAVGACARGAVARAVSCTGIAGPGGGSAEKPVGLVCMAAAAADGRLLVERHVFPGDRTAIRAATVSAAFALLRRLG